MAIGRNQKMLLHIYAQAASLNEATYRNLLRMKAGVGSAADPAFPQHGFEAAMAELERMLFARVARGEVVRPRSRYIRAETYWRDRMPTRGMITTRQHYQIEHLWSQLTEFLPDDQCNAAYLLGIAHHATGRRTRALHSLSGKQAGMVIDALRDRLAYAIRREQAQPQELPF